MAPRKSSKSKPQPPARYAFDEQAALDPEVLEGLEDQLEEADYGSLHSATLDGDDLDEVESASTEEGGGWPDEPNEDDE